MAPFDTLRISAQREPFSGSIALYAFVAGDDDKRSFVKDVTLERLQEGAYFAEPSFRLRPEIAQQLMDELWDCGLRPTEGTGSAGAMAATERHLKDLQRLVFEKPEATIATLDGTLNRGPR